MGLFSSDKITKELLEKIVSGVEAIAEAQQEQAIKLDNIEQTQKKLSAKLEEIDKRLSKIEEIMLQNFNKVLTQTELFVERLKSIIDYNYSIKEHTKILPLVKKLLDDINNQIQITPVKDIEFDNLSDSEKLMITMVKEIEKVTEKSSKELAGLIDKSSKEVAKAVGNKV